MAITNLQNTYIIIMMEDPSRGIETQIMMHLQQKAEMQQQRKRAGDGVSQMKFSLIQK